MPYTKQTGDHCVYEIATSEGIHLEWDIFLASIGGGHHVQTNMWASCKGVDEWAVKRAVACRNGSIVAGAQILFRPLPVGGFIGYIQRGPVVAAGHEQAFLHVIDECLRIVRANRIQFLLINPEEPDACAVNKLETRGFSKLDINSSPTATILIDLYKSEDELLAAMKSKTRYNVRLGFRKGLTARLARGDELKDVYDILVATSERQCFDLGSFDFFKAMAGSFGHGQHFLPFVTEFDGEIVSASICIGFADRLVFKRGGWSGRFGELRPNEVLHWSAIKWAKEAGYRFYDFDGIERAAAAAARSGEPLTGDLIKSVARFKLGFGGEVVPLAGFYGYALNPLLRWGGHHLYPMISQARITKFALERLRTG